MISITVCTCVGQPEDTIDRLGVVETKKSSRSVTVNWFKPITVNTLLHYDVNVLEKLKFTKDLLLVQNFTTKETKAEIKNLKPATNYSVKVKAVVDGDEDVPETTIDVATEKSCMCLCMPIHYMHVCTNHTHIHMYTHTHSHALTHT